MSAAKQIKCVCETCGHSYRPRGSKLKCPKCGSVKIRVSFWEILSILVKLIVFVFIVAIVAVAMC